jgi:hypothetical protein
LAELPTGTVTFLFTDLESSTRLWEQQPEAMRAALARHDELLSDAIESRSGHVIKGTGDGVHAVFATADAAVAAAIGAQRGLAVERWGVTEPLRVRMGLHTIGAPWDCAAAAVCCQGSGAAHATGRPSLDACAGCPAAEVDACGPRVRARRHPRRRAGVVVRRRHAVPDLWP